MTEKTTDLITSKLLDAANIEHHYNEVVCGNESIERVELKTILSRAKTLHEDLRNYGQLGDREISSSLFLQNAKWLPLSFELKTKTLFCYFCIFRRDFLKKNK